MATDEIDEQIRELVERAHHYHGQGSHKLALECYQKAIELALMRGKRSWLPLLYADMAGEHRDCDEYRRAVPILVAALTMTPDASDFVPLRARINKLLAITFRDIYGPEKPEVMELLGEARDAYRQMGNEGQEANVLQHIAGSHIELGNYVAAEQIMEEAMQKARATGDEQLVGWLLDDMAVLEIERNQWSTALDLARQARKKAQAVRDREGEGDTWLTEGRVYLRMGKLDEALEATQTALDLYTDNGNLRRAANARRRLAVVLSRLDRFDEAVAALNLSMDVAAQLDLRHDLTQIHIELGKLELERKNYGLAHEHAARARGLADEENLTELVVQADTLLRECRQ